MRRFMIAIIGSTLFVGGYYQVHRQVAYTAGKTTLAQPIDATATSTLPLKTQPTLAFRLDRSF